MRIKNKEKHLKHLAECQIPWWWQWEWWCHLGKYLCSQVDTQEWPICTLLHFLPFPFSCTHLTVPVFLERALGPNSPIQFIPNTCVSLSNLPQPFSCLAGKIWMCPSCPRWLAQHKDWITPTYTTRGKPVLWGEGAISQTRSLRRYFNEIITDFFDLHSFAMLPLTDKLLGEGDPSVSHPVARRDETNHQAAHHKNGNRAGCSLMQISFKFEMAFLSWD